METAAEKAVENPMEKANGTEDRAAKAPSATPERTEPWVEVCGSPGLTRWMAEHRVSLSFTTYQTGKLFLLGIAGENRLAVFERTFDRAMGLWADGQTLWLSTRWQIWRLENLLRPGEIYQGHDQLYVPMAGHTTGDLDVHDVARTADGRLVFVATSFGCLATLSERGSFAPLWQPPFVSNLVAEDRCHLNGLALVDGQPRYVTAVAPCDVVDGWRDRRRDGGVVVDVRDGRIVASGLSMPHSPRWFNGRLWLLNSGTGWFGGIDPAEGKFQPLTFCPGYLRGMAFVGPYAIIGLSRCRQDKTFGGLPLDDEMTKHGAEARTGLHIIDTRTGQVVHWIRIEGLVRELYDVAVLPGAHRPMALGFKTDEIQRVIAVGPNQPLFPA